ncbi:hypothetical protein PPL_11504 [Heterostelium album PN500]|uniref:Uncharacterized protein n=1 Tax=Heterostelium pallidum (strain ATCC 26659 / Pp 5 / PN500) TaxID=670386 RepID=D3BTK7_HETP5|nr:hypothetical protein PPL_11504 [Heterostelium album PN500]EFA75424.1 hypothetical protein PPL_11504 [Heterostelium album PN500]|eukprot:XP_020427558.1 hypothetical protein PPL_11504 [Heterostelium album PN500]
MNPKEPLTILLILLINSVILLILNIVAIATDWYYIKDEAILAYYSPSGIIPATFISYHYSLYGVRKDIESPEYTINTEYSKYTDFNNRPPYIQHFMAIGVFQYFSLFFVVALIGSLVLSHKAPKSLAPSVSVICMVLITSFQIISFFLEVSLPIAFRKENNCFLYWCSKLASTDERSQWGPRAGFFACVVLLFFCIIGVILEMKEKPPVIPMVNIPQVNYQPCEPIQPPLLFPADLDLDPRALYVVVPITSPVVGSNGDVTQYIQQNIFQKYDPSNPDRQVVLTGAQQTPPSGLIIPTNIEINPKLWYQMAQNQIPVIDPSGIPTHFVTQFVLQVTNVPSK